MRKDILAKVEFVIIMLVLIIIVVFGKDIMAAVNDAMTVQTESLVDQLFRDRGNYGKDIYDSLYERRMCEDSYYIQPGLFITEAWEEGIGGRF